MPLIILLCIGLLGGIFSGAFGIGGGTIMVPALVYFWGLTQHQAQGTTLAVLLMPVGFLGVWRYYLAGNVKVDAAVIIALGFILGALLGAHYVQGLSDAMMKRMFGIFLILVGLKMVIKI